MPAPPPHMPPSRTLLGPGPSDVPPSVLAALARPTIGHLDPAFLGVMDEVRAMLREVFRTKNDMTLAVSGTGSAGMEMLFVNLVEPGDRVLVGVNGVFGGRMVDVAQRCGAEVVAIERPWGEAFDPEEVIAAVRAHRPALTCLVHAETSTGARQPVEGIGEAVRAVDGLFLLDCVTSLAGLPVEIDAWGVDAAYSGTQKCLSCPPGLAPATLSPRAMAKLRARSRPVQSWYLDLNLVQNYWGGERAYHHTAPINMVYALHEALRLTLEEGLEARFARHHRVHEQLRAGLAEMGIRYVSQPGRGLPMLNAIAVPEGVDDAAGRRRLLEEFGIEIGAGLGAFRGKAWRIGLMGYGASWRNVALVLSALRELTAASGSGR